MKKLIEKIKEQQELTGLKIIDNPFTLGADVVKIETGKTVYRGDNITCQLFVDLYEKKILSENAPCRKA